MSNQLSMQVPDEVRATAARSEAYKILSGIFVYPDNEQIRQFVLHEAPEELRKVTPFLPYDLNAVAGLHPAVEDENVDLPADFTRLFDNCSGRALLSLHEKDHSRDAPDQIWEDLIRFYEHFGVNYHLDVNKEWPDWIGMQFEFLHLLTFLEASADGNRVQGYIAAEADFLERHTGRWIPRFSAALAKKAAGTPYAAYADVLAQFIAAELEFNHGRRPGQHAAHTKDVSSTQFQH